MGRKRNRSKGRKGGRRHVASPAPTLDVVSGTPEVAAGFEAIPRFSTLRTPSVVGGVVGDPTSGDVGAQLFQAMPGRSGVPVSDTSVDGASGPSMLVAFLVAVAALLATRFLLGLGWIASIVSFVLVFWLASMWASRNGTGA